MYSHCTTGGWILGNRIDGTQAEFVRIPHADTSLLPDSRRRRRRSAGHAERHPADRLRVRRAERQGPAGLRRSRSSAPGRSGWRRCSRRSSTRPSEIIMIDLDDNRLAVAKRFGATATVNSTDGKAARAGHDADRRARRGHGDRGGRHSGHLRRCARTSSRRAAPSPTSACTACKVDLHLERLWSHNMTITTRLVDTVSTPMLLKTVQSRTHRRQAADHASLQAGRDPGGLRHLRQGRRHQGAQGDHRSLRSFSAGNQSRNRASTWLAAGKRAAAYL